MKLLITLFLGAVLSGCSSTGGKLPAAASEKAANPEPAAVLAESSFQESNGTLTVVFDAKGKWVRLSAVGTASLADDSPGAAETALMIAGMRAKRTVAEFLRSDVRSSTVSTRLARAYDRTFQSSESQRGDGGHADDAEEETGGVSGNAPSTEKSRQARRVATALTERIQESSSAILKGVQVSRRGVEGDGVSVEVAVTPESIGVARQVSRMMSGVMK